VKGKEHRIAFTEMRPAVCCRSHDGLHCGAKPRRRASHMRMIIESQEYCKFVKN